MPPSQPVHEPATVEDLPPVELNPQPDEPAAEPAEGATPTNEVADSFTAPTDDFAATFEAQRKAFEDLYRPSRLDVAKHILAALLGRSSEESRLPQYVRLSLQAADALLAADES